MKLRACLGEYLKSLRVAKGLSQLAVAQTTGIPVTRVSNYERGIRTPSPEHIKLLSQALGISSTQLIDETDWLTPEDRRALRRASRITRQRYLRCFEYRPPRDRPMILQIRKAMAQYPNLTRGLLACIARRPDVALVEKVLSTMVAGSALEVIVHLTLLAAGADLVMVAPEASGFRQHPVVDPRTRAAVGDCEVPAYYIRVDGIDVLFIPQVAVAARRSVWCMDFLCAVIDASRRVHWLDLEVDGEGHDYAADPARTADINLPTVRLTALEVKAGTMLTTLGEKLRLTLPNLPNAA